MFLFQSICNLHILGMTYNYDWQILHYTAEINGFGMSAVLQKYFHINIRKAIIDCWHIAMKKDSMWSGNICQEVTSSNPDLATLNLGYLRIIWFKATTLLCSLYYKTYMILIISKALVLLTFAEIWRILNIHVLSHVFLI